MLTITDSAKEYLTNMTKKKGKKYAYLGVLGGGCSGFQYEWDMTVDWVNEFGGSYLKVSNPNATAQCGCGESFAV